MKEVRERESGTKGGQEREGENEREGERESEGESEMMRGKVRDKEY